MQPYYEVNLGSPISMTFQVVETGSGGFYTEMDGWAVSLDWTDTCWVVQASTTSPPASSYSFSQDTPDEHDPTGSYTDQGTTSVSCSVTA